MSLRTRLRFRLRSLTWFRFLAAPVGSRSERFWRDTHRVICRVV